ncbi:MAG: class I SAM-dependent methyltransferase [Gemmataceae bacterium]
MRYWSECGSFFREYWRHFHTTGSILPSSRFLARAMVSDVARPHPPARILEAGPGTGAVTRALVQVLQPDDRLDIVEINDAFVELLRGRFEQEEEFRQRRDQAAILHRPVEEIEGSDIYDFIVSSLPLNNFPVELVRRILRSFRRLIKPGGILTYFEYAWVRNLKMPLVPRRERRRLAQLGHVVGKYITAHQVQQDLVWLNVPPAIVRHLRFAEKNDQAAAAGTARS